MDELERIKMKKLREIMEKMSVEKVSAPINADSRNFNELLAKYENVVVDFWAEWCAPCRMISPIIEQLAKEYEGRVVFLKVNTEQNPQLAVRFGVTAIPTLIFFKRSKPVDKVVGALPKSELKRWIERNL
ncbi:MAG: thioredoxin [Archaeoglobaceae archaeon]